MKKIHGFLKVFVFVQLGVCFGSIFKKYLHYVRYPELYMVQSAPWYLNIIVTLLLTFLTVGITAGLYFVVGNIIKKREQNNAGGKNEE